MGTASLECHVFQTAKNGFEGSGIGLETALLFAERGARAVAFADKNADAAREAAEKSRKLAICSAYQALAIEVDVADHESVRRMIAKTVEEFVKIDYAVNSAGVRRAHHH